MTGRGVSLRALVLFLALSAGVLGCGVSQVETVDGLVVEVVSTSPASVERFTLRTGDGSTLVFTFDGPIEFGTTGFPGGHLREHQALAAPVRVTYRVAGSGGDRRLIVVRLEDAP